MKTEIIPARGDNAVAEECHKLQTHSDHHPPFAGHKPALRAQPVKNSTAGCEFAILHFPEMLHLLNELSTSLAETGFVLIDIFCSH